MYWHLFPIPFILLKIVTWMKTQTTYDFESSFCNEKYFDVATGIYHKYIKCWFTQNY